MEDSRKKKLKLVSESFRFEPFSPQHLPELGRCMYESWTELIDETKDETWKNNFIKYRDELIAKDFANPEIVKKKFGDATKGEGFLIFARHKDTPPDGPVAGCIGAFQNSPFELELVRMFVDKKYRGQGLATCLVHKVIDYGKTHGYERVILKCGSQSGHALYRSVGFHFDGVYYFWFPLPNQRKLTRVSLLGGTHGNELVGIHLLNEVWKDPNHPSLQEASGGTFKLDLHISNPEATKKCLRFVQRDLNRCFELTELENPREPEMSKLESKRAQELNALLGPKRDIKGSFLPWKKENPNASDYLIDMHCTTSNMGICLITLAGDQLTMRAALRVKRVLESTPGMPPFNLLVDSQMKRDVYNNIDALPPSGLCVEVGPLPHGTLNKLDLLEGTKLAVIETLKEIRDFNKREAGVSAVPIETTKLDGFELWKPLYFPKSSSDSVTVSAAIHSSLIGQDMVKILRKGDPLFVDLATSSILTYQEEEEAYACFIGEAAYFPLGIAMWLCKKQQFHVYG